MLLRNHYLRQVISDAHRRLHFPLHQISLLVGVCLLLAADIWAE
jgi:ABC-type Fe3+-siderophore transport system permease subunit